MMKRAEESAICENMIRKLINDHTSQILGKSALNEKLVTLFTRDDNTGKSVRFDLDLDDDEYKELTSKEVYSQQAKALQMTASELNNADEKTLQQMEETVTNPRLFKFTKEFTLKQYRDLTRVQRFKIYMAVQQCQKKTTEGYDVLVSHAAETILKGGPVYTDWSERNFKRDFWNFYKNAMDWEMPSKSGGNIGRGEPQLEMAYMCVPQKSGASDFQPRSMPGGYAVKFFPEEGSTVKSTHVKSAELRKTFLDIFMLTHKIDASSLTLGTRAFASEGIGDWASILKRMSQDTSDPAVQTTAKKLIDNYTEQMQHILHQFVTDGNKANGLIAFSDEEEPVLHKDWFDFRVNSFNMSDTGLTKYCRNETTGYNFPVDFELVPIAQPASEIPPTASKPKTSKMSKRAPTATAGISENSKLILNFVQEILNS